MHRRVGNGFAGAISALALAAAGLISPAQAEDTTDQKATQLEKVEVTGTRIKRTDLETAAPVTAISRAQIDRTGATSLSDLLKIITSNENGLSQEQTLGFAAGSSNINLRGCGSQYTLVLLNGRRLAPYGRPNVTTANIEPAVNIDSVPIGAVERVEILNGGGSAIYGSDAICGVVNVITQKSFNGLQAAAYYGQTSHSDGQSKQVSLTAGGNMAGFSTLFFINYYLNNGILERDRDISRTSDERHLGGINFSSSVGDPATVDAVDDDGNNVRTNLCDPATVSGSGAGVCHTNRNYYAPLVPPTHRVSIFGSVNKDLFSAGEFTMSAYLDALINRETVKGAYYPTPVSTANDADLVSGQNNPYTQQFIDQLNARQAAMSPAGAHISPQDLSIRYDFTAVGPRLDRYEDLQDRYTFGFKGTLFGAWTYDVAGLYTSDTNDDYGSNYVSKPLIVQALTNGLQLTDAQGNTQTEYFNVFGAGNSPEMINALKIRLDTHALSTIRSLDATVGGPLANFSDGSALSLAIGAERMLEGYENDPDSQQSGSNVVALSTGTPVDGARNSTAVYAELDAKFRTYAELQIAGRHEHYSDFGSNNKPKFALKVTPLDWIVLRAGLDKGFRAPSLADLFAAQSTAFANGYVDSLRCPNGTPINPAVPSSDCDRSGLYQVTVGGNPNLKAEQARSYYYGIVVEPVRDLSVGFDVFDIRIDNIVTQLPVQLLIDQNTPGVVERGPPTFNGDPGPIVNIFNGFINGAFQQFKGFDADVSYLWSGVVIPRSVGRLKSTFSMSYTDKYKYADANTPEASYAGTDAFGLAVPRIKAYLEHDYDMGPFGAVLRTNFVGKYNDDFVSGNKVGSWTSWDVQGKVQPPFAKGVTFTLGINNLFDRMPPFNPGAAAYSATFSGYDPTLYSAEGRFIYASVQYRIQ